jgi:hypothetical protein
MSMRQDWRIPGSTSPLLQRNQIQPTPRPNKSLPYHCAIVIEIVINDEEGSA